MSASETSVLPDYAPIPREALVPALNEKYGENVWAALKGLLGNAIASGLHKTLQMGM